MKIKNNFLFYPDPDSELRYPYEELKNLMHVFDSFDDKALILELLEGMYAELPEKNKRKPDEKNKEIFHYLFFSPSLLL